MNLENMMDDEKLDGGLSALTDVLDGERCETCKYWKASDCTPLADGEGNCRRYPPVLDLSDQEEWKSKMESCADGYSYLDYRFWNFPVVEGIEWCGEWRASNA